MSNMVLVAVRHKNLDQIAALSFDSIVRAMNYSDACQKKFDLELNGYSPATVENFGLENDLIVSHAYSGATEAVFYLNNLGMTQASFLSGAKIGQEEETGLEAHIAAFRFNARQQRLSVVKNRKSEPKPLLTGDRYSVFGILTDQLNDIERNSHAMEDIGHYCRYKEFRLRTFSNDGVGIRALGTFKAGQALVVQMSKGQFHKEIWPSHAITLEDVEGASSGSERVRSTNLESSMIREIAEGAGYSTIIKIKAGKPT
jgi:hypothetical protein